MVVGLISGWSRRDRGLGNTMLEQDPALRLSMGPYGEKQVEGEKQVCRET